MVNMYHGNMNFKSKFLGKWLWHSWWSDQSGFESRHWQYFSTFILHMIAPLRPAPEQPENVLFWYCVASFHNLILISRQFRIVLCIVEKSHGWTLPLASVVNQISLQYILLWKGFSLKLHNHGHWWSANGDMLISGKASVTLDTHSYFFICGFGCMNWY